MEISGKIVTILPAENIGSAGKLKQTFVLETEGQFPKKIAFDVWDNRFELDEGEIVTLSINIESREWNKKWFTNVTAWKRSVGSSDSQGWQEGLQQPEKPSGGALVQRGKHQVQSLPPIEGDDDLPF